MRVLPWIAAAFFLTGVADAWVKRRWDHSRSFKKLGLTDLTCPTSHVANTDDTAVTTPPSLPASCCLCQTFMQRIETNLNATENDHEMDVVFRISEEKKTIPYSRSEGRILEVLESVCKDVSLPDPHTSPKVKVAVKNACQGFVDEFADDLIGLYYNNLAPQQTAMCVDRLQLCASQLNDEL
ncbi:hypothetical protein H257_16936 [Aphanomyces astaci]|uniref:Saposin B-type domain-containing protein n=1 Tax=Aphanomyces astaci TaxID=112090 RepID=W4FIH0_APHAT|nr:hypothetical protein H257_16936 [Aphanomyces astaci]ETV66629.1 hypothetical protein H257_16936 [Aphanomyces astaci]|eukprot:XP_009843858.1 hypothetical protein H257_16936 [Aphanomyces astaci]